MFNLNDKVLVDFRGTQHEAVIIDIEQCSEYIDPRTRKASDKKVFTGRYGVRFVGENPTIIEIPYFWKKELTLISELVK